MGLFLAPAIEKVVAWPVAALPLPIQPSPALVATSEPAAADFLAANSAQPAAVARPREKPAPGAMLTLTTCHPKGSASQRLVIQAALVSTGQTPTTQPGA